MDWAKLCIAFILTCLGVAVVATVVGLAVTAQAHDYLTEYTFGAVVFFGVMFAIYHVIE
jgi:hypothetical protein